MKSSLSVRIQYKQAMPGISGFFQRFRSASVAASGMQPDQPEGSPPAAPRSSSSIVGRSDRIRVPRYTSPTSSPTPSVPETSFASNSCHLREPASNCQPGISTYRLATSRSNSLPDTIFGDGFDSTISCLPARKDIGGEIHYLVPFSHSNVDHDEKLVLCQKLIGYQFPPSNTHLLHEALNLDRASCWEIADTREDVEFKNMRWGKIGDAVQYLLLSEVAYYGTRLTSDEKA